MNMRGARENSVTVVILLLIGLNGCLRMRNINEPTGNAIEAVMQYERLDLYVIF